MTRMPTSLSLYFTNKHRFGPGKVASNLIRGLKHLGVEVFESCPGGQVTGMLQSCPEVLQEPEKFPDLLVGPNLFVLPGEWPPETLAHWTDFVVPSPWVARLYEQCPEVSHARFHPWPVGIDTDTWSERAPNKRETRALLYCKNRSETDIRHAEFLLGAARVPHVRLDYGSYQEQDLLRLCQEEVTFCVLCTGTESQGIAYMQMLSSGLPCFVYDTTEWVDNHGTLRVPATSVPYFDERCGVKVSSLKKAVFADFLSRLSEFRPREFILESHTLAHGASQYLEIFERTGRF
jgi:hypothetical protein